MQVLRKPSQAATPEQRPHSAKVAWGAVTERLRQYADARGPAPTERCELCGDLLHSTRAGACREGAEWGVGAQRATEPGCGAEPHVNDDHGHLVNLPRRELLCVCQPCYLLFAQ